MRKLAICCVILLLAAALVVAGCGSKKETTSTPNSSGNRSAQKILEESSKKMQTVKSAKAAGAYKMTTSAASSATAGQNMDFAFEMEMDLSDQQKPEMKMAMKGMGQDTVLYITGGYTYMEVPGQGWVKSPVGDTGSMSETSPAEIAKFAENAENLKIMSESGDSYKISFDIGQDMLKEQMGAQQNTSELGPEVQKMIDDMIKNMKMTAVFTINKSTMYIVDARINMAVKNFPMVGDMTLDMAMKFSDFDQPVSVSLPPEAANATETAEIPSSTTGVPGFPGFGL